MFGEVVIDNEDILALVHEMFRNGYTGVWCKVLHRRPFGSTGMYDDGVIHSASSSQPFVYTDDVGVLLPDGNINTNDILPLLVQNGINSDGGLACTAVADDQLTLSAADQDMESIHFRPVCSGTFTGCLSAMPGALISMSR